jgi:L-lactate dehydrogenase complex protein LldG
MNDARAEILAAINRNRARHRQAEIPPHIVPRRAMLPAPQRLELFTTMARKSAASVQTINSDQELPAAVQDYLHSASMHSRHIFLNGTELTRLNWSALKITQDYRSELGISRAFCGIAETGSLGLMSAPAISAAAWFLPEILIVTVAKDRIYGSQEEGWAALRTQLRTQWQLARTLTFMTGPSRTGDIEQKIVIGAHGPKKLHIVIIERETA